MIKNLLLNWKTTSAGILMIVTASVKIAFLVHHGMIDENTLAGPVASLLGGIGLMFAGDAAQSRQQHEDLKADAARAIRTGDTSMLVNPAGLPKDSSSNNPGPTSPVVPPSRKIL